MSSHSTSAPGSLPVLFADDYGFHTGNTWYRGRFRATGAETGIHLQSDVSGGAQAFSAWLNGVFLGSSTTGSADFTFPAGAVKGVGDNVVSVLTVNMGHEEDYNEANGNKAARGLIGANLLGGADDADLARAGRARRREPQGHRARGALHRRPVRRARGLVADRLPGRLVDTVTLPYTDTTPGVSWYRTNVALDLPRDQDTSLGLTITDDRVAPLPGDAVRQRLGGRQLRQLPRPAAQLPGAERDPEPERRQHDRDRGLEPRRHAPAASARSR